MLKVTRLQFPFELSSTATVRNLLLKHNKDMSLHHILSLASVFVSGQVFYRLKFLRIRSKILKTAYPVFKSSLFTYRGGNRVFGEASFITSVCKT
jgi:hypothetical protein